MKRNKMLPEQRRQQILKSLGDRGVITTSDIAETHGVSLMTARKDLDLLAIQGHLARIHGGAIALLRLSTEPSYVEKASLNPREKQAIGRKAACLIEEGMAIFIGNGTTTMEIIRNLPSDRHIRIFTNSLNHATALASLPNVAVVVVGGLLRGVSFAMVGVLGHRMLQNVYFDLAFFGVNGLSLDHGLTLPSREEAEMVAEVIRHSQRTVIVADHTKFGVVAHGRIGAVSDIDTIITDSGLELRFREAMSKQEVGFEIT
ncbi:MAG: HTH-type transcriptional regulator GlpR [ANME-2 cluster archaeon]|nr:HTH-type transcriptional regulator GlpR [ANME-2 cluster archaeon]